MNSTALKDVLHRAENWPSEDQEELIKAALYIEQRHSGEYTLTEEDWKIIDARLEAARPGLAPSPPTRKWRPCSANSGLHESQVRPGCGFTNIQSSPPMSSPHFRLCENPVTAAFTQFSHQKRDSSFRWGDRNIVVNQ